MIIGIVGSRRRNTAEDYLNLCWKIVELERSNNTLTKKIVTGDCDEGGDKFARKIAEDITEDIELDVKRIRDPETGEEMDFKNHRWFNYFNMCNIFYKRDKEIVKEPLDYLIALVAPDRTGGTEYTITQFKKYHKDWEDKLIIL